MVNKRKQRLQTINTIEFFIFFKHIYPLIMNDLRFYRVLRTKY
ncbi:hypothetical protein PPHE_a4024 [Pseudoalteromonas phenolica O-BC30]|nr:hypothetical protein [Pseudoalteromonas phenolica O-BC30]